MWRQRGEARPAKRWHHCATSERQEAKPQHVVSLPFHTRALLALLAAKNKDKERGQSLEPVVGGVQDM